MLSPSTPLTSGAQEIVRPSPKSLEELRPFPKAGPRKPSSLGRKKGIRCRILTATSEKCAVEAEVAAKLKKNISKNRTVQKAKNVCLCQLIRTPCSKLLEEKQESQNKTVKELSDDESLALFISDKCFIDIEVVREQTWQRKFWKWKKMKIFFQIHTYQLH